MKKLIYFLGLSAFLLLIACGGNGDRQEEQNNFREEPPSALESAKAIEVPEEPEKESVEVKDLPEGILDYVEEDALLSTLELSKAEKVEMKEGIYYELTFVDEEDQLILVTLNEEGKIIDS